MLSRPLAAAVVPLVLAVATAASATSWGVPGDGSGTCTIAVPSCNTVQAAIDAATAGDDVQLAPGTHAEPSIHVTKPLTIEGTSFLSTFIQPTPVGVGMFIDADGVVLRNVTIENGTDGIRFEMAGGTIDDTELDAVRLRNNSSDGIEVGGATTVTDLAFGGIISGNNNGIRMSSTSTVVGLTVDASTIENNASVGIYQANDGGTSTLTDLTVTNTEFQGNVFAAIYAEEIRDSVIQGNVFEGNGRGILVFKGYTTSGVDVGNVAITANEFIDQTDASVQLVIQASALAAAIAVQSNEIDQDVGVLAANWATIDVRLGNAFTHAPVNVTSNRITLSGTFGTATAAHGIQLRGNGPLVATDNTLTGGGVGGSGTTPPSSGLYVRSQDPSPSYGTIPATAIITATCNRVGGFVNGVSVWDGVGNVLGGLAPGTTVDLEHDAITGNGTGVANGASPTIDAEDVFWGCAAGPGNPGCDAVVGAVDTDPVATLPPACAPCSTNAQCDDGNLCTQSACQAAHCTHDAEPRDPGTCFAAQKASFQIKRNATTPAKNQLQWKWNKGDGVSQMAMGFPDATTDYALCVYDRTVGVPSLAIPIQIAPGAAWQNKIPKGWKYKDKTLASDGVQSMLLKTGVAGKTQAQLKAKGVALPLSTPVGATYFTQDPDVVVQLVNELGTCWTSAFAAAGTKKNDPAQFKAKAP